jgi:hypothetical protein
MSRLDKMSVTEREVKLEDLTRGISLSGTIIKDFAGVVVTYDFYPVSPVSLSISFFSPFHLTVPSSLGGDPD